MKLKLVDEKDNRLLHRKEITYEVTFDAATPSKEELQNQIGAQQKVDPELVETKGIYTKFGSKKAKVYAHVYDTVDDLNDIEPPVLVKE